MARLLEIVDVLTISGSLFYIRNYSCFCGILWGYSHNLVKTAADFVSKGMEGRSAHKCTTIMGKISEKDGILM